MLTHFSGSTKTSRLRHKIALKRFMPSPRETDDINEEELEEQENYEEIENEEKSLGVQTNSDIGKI